MPSHKRNVQESTVTTQAELAAIVAAITKPEVGKVYGDFVRYAPTGSLWVVAPGIGANVAQLDSVGGNVDVCTLLTGADLSGYVNRLVEFDATTGTLIAPTTAGQSIFGVLLAVDSAAVGAKTIVRTNGLALVYNTGGVTRGDWLCANGANGNVKTLPTAGLLTTTGGANPEPVTGSFGVGRALTTALTTVVTYVQLKTGILIPQPYV